jgi:hypothetical protein
LRDQNGYWDANKERRRRGGRQDCHGAAAGIIVILALPATALLGKVSRCAESASFELRPEFKVFSAAMLNAEAGTHPVPSDPRELEASLRAGERCWRRFPYLAERYGERGLRFTRSDSAWLATLTRHEPPVVHQQVRWLRDVLATRGVPSVLLQTHLEILSDALGDAVPADRAAHDRLRQAAAGLRDARQAHIADAQATALSDRFTAAAGAEWCARLPQTPLLLVSAVADECDGCLGAAAALGDWLSDGRRFPPAWIAAVAAALAQARAAADAGAPRVGT